MKWYTVIEVLDIETGEIIDKNINIEEWVKINKTEKYEFNEENTKGTKTIRYTCRKRGKQLKLKFDGW